MRRRDELEDRLATLFRALAVSRREQAVAERGEGEIERRLRRAFGA